MTRAEQIIRKRIANIQDNMDSIIDYEVESETAGIPIPEYERKQNDKRWGELFDRKVMLIDILAEIMEVPYMTAYHSL